MNLVLTNMFIYFGLGVFGFLFLMGQEDLSFATNFLDINSIDTRVLVMLFLAEPHFAMTLPLLYGYRDLFYKEPFIYIIIPILIIITSTLLFFFQSGLFFLVFLLANVYHVNRQSVGFLKLQTKLKLPISKLYEICLHLLTILCLYYALKLNQYSVTLAFYILLTFILVMALFAFIFEKKVLNLRELLVISQGFLIFLPIIIFEDILLAFAVGISIHYIQYLSLSWNVLRKGFGFKVAPILLVVCAYALFSTGALSGIMTKEQISLIVFLPTQIQLLHFYYDGFIWRRSDKLVASTMAKTFK